mgnify:FL=1
MGNRKKLLAGCLMIAVAGLVMTGCGNRNNNTTVTETTTSTGNAKVENTEKTTEKNTTKNDGGVLEDVGAGIGEAGDDVIDGAADAVDRLTDDGIDSENTENTNAGAQ